VETRNDTFPAPNTNTAYCISFANQQRSAKGEMHFKGCFKLSAFDGNNILPPFFNTLHKFTSIRPSLKGQQNDSHRKMSSSKMKRMLMLIFFQHQSKCARLAVGLFLF
jgi:hypothetical protein